MGQIDFIIIVQYTVHFVKFLEKNNKNIGYKYTSDDY